MRGRAIIAGHVYYSARSRPEIESSVIIVCEDVNTINITKKVNPRTLNHAKYNCLRWVRAVRREKRESDPLKFCQFEGYYVPPRLYTVNRVQPAHDKNKKRSQFRGETDRRPNGYCRYHNRQISNTRRRARYVHVYSNTTPRIKITKKNNLTIIQSGRRDPRCSSFITRTINQNLSAIT